MWRHLDIYGRDFLRELEVPYLRFLRLFLGQISQYTFGDSSEDVI